MMTEKHYKTEEEVQRTFEGEINFARFMPAIIKRGNAAAKNAPRHQRATFQFERGMETYQAIMGLAKANEAHPEKMCLTVFGSGFSVTLEGETAMQFCNHPNKLLAKVIGAGWIIAPCR